jgi:hypothetical protein
VAKPDAAGDQLDFSSLSDEERVVMRKVLERQMASVTIEHGSADATTVLEQDADRDDGFIAPTCPPGAG